jgi:hypothetical protein
MPYFDEEMGERRVAHASKDPMDRITDLVQC